MMTENSHLQGKDTKKQPIQWKYIWILPIGILALAAIIKIISPEAMAENFEAFNLKRPVQFIVIIGIIELALVITFLIPATRGIGFLLLTAFIGGIIAIEATISESIPLFPIFLQFTLWVGIYFEKKAIILPLLPQSFSLILDKSNLK